MRRCGCYAVGGSTVTDSVRFVPSRSSRSLIEFSLTPSSSEG